MTRMVIASCILMFACSPDLRTEPIDGGDGDGDVNVTVTVNNNFGPTTTTTDTTSTTTSTDGGLSGLSFKKVCIDWDGPEADAWINNWDGDGWDPVYSTDDTLCMSVMAKGGDRAQLNANYTGCNDADGECNFAEYANDALSVGEWRAGSVTVDGEVYGFQNPATLDTYDLEGNGLGGDPTPSLNPGDAKLFEDLWSDNGIDHTGVGLVIVFK